MNGKVFALIVCLSICIGSYISFKALFARNIAPTEQVNIKRVSESLQITSSSFSNDGMIPVTFTCRAENIHPPLSFHGIPEQARTLAIIVEDPDAPLGTFVHWVIWNIPSSIKDIDAGILPAESQQGTNSFGHEKYDGPCPPAQHRYYFTVYALDARIGLDGKANKINVMDAIKGHVIDQAQIIGRFGN